MDIVEDIKRRVASGKLKPGDRLPPVRQVARQWGVALATATKAMNTLQQQGIVRARPRVGTVVAAPSTEPPPEPAPETALSRERVVRVAIELADAEGLGALTMRGIAAKLGVAPMSPYKYVGGKDDLILLMADAAYAELGYPTPLPEGWRARLELVGRTLWTLHRRHPWLAQVTPLSRPVVLPHLAVHAEQALAALEGLGFDAVTRLNLHVLFYSSIQGLVVNAERETQAQSATGLSEDEWMDSQEADLRRLVATGDHPAFAAMLEGVGDGYDLDLDMLFELGLKLQLDGLATMIEAATRQ
ncbi:GntR family transcriptional regulator [Nonomuraea africana]|uniref:DNA-binding transcriptional regulator YhcF (GntR family) n=1 Tax=Nonomuraea africana TaxID=46171 RepID=A0ABR9KT73_9ACTN|nr:TetR/AcrR family transcriptional regulator C-terminal domain-containing protein [Nonomuraea africana]MBE1565234.1 DNA-binding transcriptional regulator YhcF (GntR family) [Nonomuraea africana]